MTISSCLTIANSKLRSTFFSIINNGIYENGIHPITSLKIYKAVVLPKALYGCELWHDITKTQLVKLERSHKFCIKYIQCIVRSTRSDIALSLLGCRSLESEIDYKKLTLLGQLCRLSTDFISKDLFNNRLIRFIDDPHNKSGFFPDLYRILQKYDLVYFLNNYVTYGIFPTKFHWKSVIRDRIDKVSSLTVHTRMESDSKLHVYALYNNINRCSPLWLFCKKHPKMLIECQSTIKILSKLYSHEYNQICFRCGMHTSTLAEHIIYECDVNEQYRHCLWTKLLNIVGLKNYMSFIRTDTRVQITQLCTGLCVHLNKDDQDKCIQLVIFYFHKMFQVT